MCARSYMTAAVAAGLVACGSDGGTSPGETDDDGIDLSRNGSISGTHTLEEVDIPAGVTITVTGPLVLNSTGGLSIAGSLVGDCVPVTLNGLNLLITGRIENACDELPEDEAPPTLRIVGTGELTIDGAEIVTSGDLEIMDDPTLTEASFDAPPPGAAAAGAGAGAVTRVIRDTRFRADPARARDGVNGVNGTPGRDASNWRLLMRGDLIVDGGIVLTGQSGGHGGEGTHTGAPAESRGGRGGDGGRISILALGSVSFGGQNEMRSGSGGNGGSATANASPGSGARAPSATARGGDGGEPGLMRIEGGTGVSVNAGLQVVVGTGGAGGNAEAVAADGQALCIDGHGQHGGHANAEAGSGGSSPDRRLVELGNVSINGDPPVSGGHGGKGGNAVARAGNGAPGQDCDSCKDGGDGGNFRAVGGAGGSGRIRDLQGDLTGDGGDGGSSEHRGGNGGNGSDCCTPPVSEGGNGGAGGNASGGDGEAGTGRNDGAPLGVTIGSGNGGAAGDGVGPGTPGDGGSDNTIAMGPKVAGAGVFLDGAPGTSCPAAPPPGASIAGNYTLVASRTAQMGPCSSSPGFTNPNVHIEFDGTNVIVNSDAAVTGSYDPLTGRWTGTGTTEPNASGFRLRETLDGTWMVEDEGVIVFEGTLTYEILDPDGEVVCSSTYQVQFRKN